MMTIMLSNHQAILQIMTKPMKNDGSKNSMKIKRCMNLLRDAYQPKTKQLLSDDNYMSYCNIGIPRSGELNKQH